MHASTTAIIPTAQNSNSTAPDLGNTPPLSVQAVLTLALIDSLSFLRVDDLKEWLPLTGELINAVPDRGMRVACIDRFWEAISGGEMDVDRAHCCVAWWSTQGGRELVLYGAENSGDVDAGADGDADGPFMSGAIGVVAPESKL